MLFLFRDARARRIVGQVAVIGLFFTLLFWFGRNAMEGLDRRGITLGFDFLTQDSRFGIDDSTISFSSSDSMGRAIIVGLANTCVMSIIVIVVSTILGFFVAIARRSNNPLARFFGAIYVDSIRNTPLIVQLLFWYAIVIFGLPNARQALRPFPGVYLSQRGLYLPVPNIRNDSLVFWCLAAGFVLLSIIAATIYRRRTLRALVGSVRIYLTSIGLALLALVIAGRLLDVSLSLSVPVRAGFSFSNGIGLSAEFTTLLVGLNIYSTAFAGEIIRGGLDAVPRGQWEAGRALGLPERQTLYLIALPQALRTMIPSMTNQFFGIVKNTTLSQVIGYADVTYVINTVITQTGHAIEGIAILVAIFLLINVFTSVAMSRLNKRFALVKR